MILSSVSKHVKEQNWFAVFIDFFIVVIGVFIGIQVANWNDNKTEKERERVLLGEVRYELIESIRQLKIKRNAFEQVGRSGARAIAFLDSKEHCDNNCWPLIVDFFHASQWLQISLNRPSFDEMRRNGWPNNRQIITALEAYHRQAGEIMTAISQPPAYRAIVRGLIPLAIQKYYWLNCYNISNGYETYVEDCPAGATSEVSAAVINVIKSKPQIYTSLTEWTGFSTVLVDAMDSYIGLAENVIPIIDEELERMKAGR